MREFNTGDVVIIIENVYSHIDEIRLGIINECDNSNYYWVEYLDYDYLGIFHPSSLIKIGEL